MGFLLRRHLTPAVQSQMFMIGAEAVHAHERGRAVYLLTDAKRHVREVWHIVDMVKVRIDDIGLIVL